MSQPIGRPSIFRHPKKTTIEFEADELMAFKAALLRQGESMGELFRQYAREYTRNHQSNEQGRLDESIEAPNHFYMPTLGETKQRKFEKVDQAQLEDVIEILRNSAEWEHEAAAKLRRLGYSEEDIKKAMKGEKI